MNLLLLSLAILPEARPPARPRASALPSTRPTAPTALGAAYRDPDVLSQQIPLPMSSAFSSAAPVAASQQAKVAALKRKLEQARADLIEISADFEGLLTSIAATEAVGAVGPPLATQPSALTVGDALAARASASSSAPAASATAWDAVSSAPPAPRAAGSPEIAVRIIGVGGSGGNTINRLAAHVAPYGGEAMRTLAINTDRQVLETSRAHETILISAPPDAAGKRRHLGQGAGGDPSVGAAAARAHAADVGAALEGADMVFITGGMGGGTGSGAAPEIARLARERGALTVGVVTRPFGFEGTRRREHAEAAIADLAKHTDALVVISNDRLLSQLPAGTSVEHAFAAADDVLRQAICAVAEIVLDTGLINVDFNDLRAVMSDSGPSLVGIGMADGSAAEAARAAIECPLLETAAADAKGIVFNVCGSQQLSLREVHAAADAISSIVAPDANIIFGARLRLSAVVRSAFALGARRAPACRSCCLVQCGSALAAACATLTPQPPPLPPHRSAAQAPPSTRA